MCKMTVTTVLVILAAIAFITPSAHAQCTSTQLAAPIAGDAFAGDQFGRSVAVHESLAVVGAPEDDFGEGSAYVYKFDGAAWQQVAKLTASDGATGNKFGTSVGVSGDVIVVGCSHSLVEKIIKETQSFSGISLSKRIPPIPRRDTFLLVLPKVEYFIFISPRPSQQFLQVCTT